LFTFLSVFHGISPARLARAARIDAGFAAKVLAEL
jgi:hypothetical protein